uniref:TLC domain-containing protein n=1 Tax=Macrostomum lignano TaxID=282301 RepID=A0A1I8FGF1_9PLAT
LQSWQLAAKRLLAAAYSPRYLLATNCATAGSLFVLADCAAQRIETLAGGSSAIRAHDWRRSGRLGLIGPDWGRAGSLLVPYAGQAVAWTDTWKLCWPRLRLFFVTGLAAVWDVFLSWYSHRSRAVEE